MAINNVNNGLPKAPVDNNKVNSQQQPQQNKTAAQQAAASTAQQLNQVQKKSAEAPVNQEKVDKLKKAIQSGEYKVDPQSLAKKIARLESEIFGFKS